MVILDEAHFIKDYKTARYKSSEKIAKKAKRLILLSGTPALSRPIELYSQISLIAPKLFRFEQICIIFTTGRPLGMVYQGCQYFGIISLDSQIQTDKKTF